MFGHDMVVPFARPLWIMPSVLPSSSPCPWAREDKGMDEPYPAVTPIVLLLQSQTDPIHRNSSYRRLSSGSGWPPVIAGARKLFVENRSRSSRCGASSLPRIVWPPAGWSCCRQSQSRSAIFFHRHLPSIQNSRPLEFGGNSPVSAGSRTETVYRQTPVWIPATVPLPRGSFRRRRPLTARPPLRFDHRRQIWPSGKSSSYDLGPVDSTW